MKKALKILSILLIFGFVASINAQSGFEGRIKFNINTEGKSTNIDYFVKGNKFAMKTQEAGQDANMIFDMGEKKMLIVMNDQKMYMEMPMDLSQKMDEAVAEKDVKINFTGETKKIKGYDCEKMIAESKDGKSIAWVTKDLGSFMFMENPMGGGQSEWQKQFAGKGFFPMEMTAYDENGKENVKMEVVEVEKKSLDSNMFTVPSGYQKFQMPAFDMNKVK